jgi:nucleotide-binding universal stress UspA family protein
MKVLLAVDGSDHSQAALEAVAARKWPASTEIRVLTVIHSKWPVVGDPFFTMASARAESMRDQEHDAPMLLENALSQIRQRAAGVSVTSRILEGVPHAVIVQEAESWGADLIVLGSHGYGPVRRALLGSVAAAVAVEAPCAVEIIRIGRPSVTAAIRSKGFGSVSSLDANDREV